MQPCLGLPVIASRSMRASSTTARSYPHRLHRAILNSPHGVGAQNVCQLGRRFRQTPAATGGIFNSATWFLQRRGLQSNQSSNKTMEQHWNNIYSTKDNSKVSWYEPEPAFSLEIVLAALGESARLSKAPKESIRIIDVGGGTSLLSRDLLRNGFTKLTVADISRVALSNARARYGEANAAYIEWKEADVTADAFEEQRYDLWHDRAVFHFMVTPEQQQAYARNCAKSLADGGIAIVSAFSKNGPKKCSDIEVAQQDEVSFRRVFTPEMGFKFVRSQIHVHTTPAGNPQEFVFCIFERVSRSD